jgi:hypothetical protein
MKVLDDSGRRMTDENIEKVFLKVLNQSLSLGCGDEVALMTSQHRDKVQKLLFCFEFYLLKWFNHAVDRRFL